MTSVLIVDDEPDILLMLRVNLEADGFETALAADGETALRRIAEERFDVVVLDLMMPVMDGWTFAREYRRRFGTRARLIVMTAATHARAWAAQVDADAVLAKPFDINELVDVVEGCVQR